MPYGIAAAHVTGNRVTIQVELPARGEVRPGGKAEDLVDPKERLHIQRGGETIQIDLTMYRPLRQQKRSSTVSKANACHEHDGT